MRPVQLLKAKYSNLNLKDQVCLYLTPVCPGAVDGVDPHVGDVENDHVVVPRRGAAVGAAPAVGVDHKRFSLEELGKG